MTERKKIIISPKSEDWDSTFQLMSWWEPEKVRNAQVMVVGSGALGNEVLKNLALLGVGNIVIVDFDIIEYSNLSRSVLFRAEDSKDRRLKVEVAAERIRAINPEVSVFPVNGDIIIDVGLGVFRRMDVIIGCLDNRLARLFMNQYAFWMGKSWIDGAIENLAGQLNVYTPGVSCYETNLSPEDKENIEHRVGCPDVARRNLEMGKIPTTPLAASIIAAMQVQEALKVIHGYQEKVLGGKTFYYEGMNNEMFNIKTPPPSADAMSSFFYDPIHAAPELSYRSTIAEVLEWAETRFNDPEPVIRLHHRVVTELKNAEKTHSVLKAFHKLEDRFVGQYFDDPVNIVTNSVGHIDRHFPHQHRPIKDLGIPPLHILKIYADGAEHFVELTGDEAYLNYQ